MMRENVKSLSWTLWIVIIAFIVYYIPDIISGSKDYVAKVGSETITIKEYQKAFEQKYRTMVYQYKDVYKDQFTPEFIRRLNLEKTTLQELINSKVILSEAREQGIFATDDEVSAMIKEFPAFQDQSGRFGGRDYYKLVLAEYFHMTPADFENAVRDQIIHSKFRNLITAGIIIPEQSLMEEYRNRNEKIKFDYLTLERKNFSDQIDFAEEEMKAFFEENRENYRTTEKRNFDYAYFKTSEIQEGIEVTDEQIREEYDNSRETSYKRDEQRRARHILLKVPAEATDEEAAALKQQAEDLLTRIRAGEDFEELAKQYSEDDMSKVEGGDLGLFSRGRMVPEFDEKAFTMAIGEVSEPVRTDFGWHLIKLEEIVGGGYIPFEDVQDSIRRKLTWPRAQEEAERRAAQFAAKAKEATSLAGAAVELGLELKETGFFEAGDRLPDIGSSPEFTEAAFAMETGAISDPIKTSLGQIVLQFKEAKEPYLPQLDEVHKEVDSDFRKEIADRLIGETVSEMDGLIEEGRGLDELAEKYELEIQHAEPVSRTQPLPVLGLAEDFFDEVFTLDTGQVSKVVALETAHAVFKLVEKEEIDPQQYADEKEDLRDEMENRERSKFFNTTMNALKEKWYNHSESDLRHQNGILQAVANQYLQ
jgi:peptidyl-prolyl cis-trans isomerase D